MDNRKTPNHIDLWKNTDKKRAGTSFHMWKNETASNPIATSAQKAAENAKSAAEVSLPVITGIGISMLGMKGDYISALAPLGIPVIVGGIVLDTVKAPFCWAVATEEGIRAGITKLTSLLFEPAPDVAHERRIYESFLLRLKETATLLVLLNLEDANVLDTKLKSGNIEELIGLTLLHTAYASRDYYAGLLLASNKVLERKDCPPQGLALFDKIMELKALIKESLVSALKKDYRYFENEQKELDESRIACKWITQIKQGHEITPEPGKVSEAECKIVNKIIGLIEELKQQAQLLLSEKNITHDLPRLGRR